MGSKRYFEDYICIFVVYSNVFMFYPKRSMVDWVTGRSHFLELIGCKEPMEPRKHLVAWRSSPSDTIGRAIERLLWNPFQRGHCCNFLAYSKSKCVMPLEWFWIFFSFFLEFIFRLFEYFLNWTNRYIKQYFSVVFKKLENIM